MPPEAAGGFSPVTARAVDLPARKGLLALTAAAKTCKGQLAALDLAAGAFFSVAAQGVRHFDLRQINDGVTIAADEMDMGLCVGVKPLDAPDGGNALDDALGLEPGQIPVHRSQGNVRMLLVQHFVDHFRGRMGIRTLQAGQNGVALFELLGLNFHWHLRSLGGVLFAIDSYLRDEYIMASCVCQEENENNLHFN